MEVPVFRICVPGRHTARIHRLNDRFAPTCDLIVVRQRERTNLARSMALDTMLVQNPRYLVAKRDVRSGRRGIHRRFYSADQATCRFGTGNCDRRSIQQLIQRKLQVMTCWLLASDSWLVLIVDASAISYG